MLCLVFGCKWETETFISVCLVLGIKKSRACLKIRCQKTFQHWPRTAPVSAHDLVQAGFFYVGPRDEVQCFCCGGILKDWRPGDCPVMEHLNFFPSCKYVGSEDVGNQELSSLQEMFDTVDGQFLSLLQGIVSEDTALPNEPEYPEMATEEMRLSTFENWPQNSSMHPEQLARAGFFYTGRCSGEMSLILIQVNSQKFYYVLLHLEILASMHIVVKNHILPSACTVVSEQSMFPGTTNYSSTLNAGGSIGGGWCLISNVLLISLSGQGDVVRCFYCDGGVRSWSVGDDPWREHAKWYPDHWKMLANPSEDQSALVHNVLQMGFDPTWVANLVENKFALTGTFYESESELISELLQSGWGASSSLSTEEQLRRLREERMCKVCMDKDVSVVFVPCGHLVSCAECALNLRMCPICRAVIQGSVRAFMS
uniref:RING-type E3 ubiquitin transferase n=1 Tax=Malurus cyaneus samueli TaxID=2593467 RepID=A0A8C5TCN8_9PASS